MVYADIGPNTMNKPQLLVLEDYDKVQYAELKQSQNETPHLNSMICEASKCAQVHNACMIACVMTAE